MSYCKSQFSSEIEALPVELELSVFNKSTFCRYFYITVLVFSKDDQVLKYTIYTVQFFPFLTVLHLLD